jgi:hypothetical protein
LTAETALKHLASTPFVAGVAALIAAANGGQTGQDVEHRLLADAWPNPRPKVTRLVAAYGAVLNAMGVNEFQIPPHVEIVSPSDGSVLSTGLINVTATAADYRGNVVDVNWTSNTDSGFAASGANTTAELSITGPQTLTATAVSSDGRSSASVNVSVNEAVPLVEITEPSVDGAVVDPSLPVRFSAIVTNIFGLDCGRIVWSGDIAGSPNGILTGCSVSLFMAQSGANIVRATYTTISGLSTGHAERLVVAGLAAGVDVIITSPIANRPNGVFAAALSDVIHLDAAVSNAPPGPLTVTWYFNEDNGTVHVIGTGQTLDWVATSTFGFNPGCGSIHGNIVASVTSGSQSASDTIGLLLEVPPC